MKKILSVVLCALLFLFPLAGCKKESDLTKVRVNEVTHSIFYAPMYLADSMGFFEDEGIEIELTNGGGADKVMSAVLSGEADIGFCGPEAALYVLAGGSTDVPKVFGQLTKRDGSFLVSRINEPNFEWTDLRGKEILAGRQGGVPAMTFEYVLNQNGLTDGTDVTLNFDVAFNLMTAAFEGGTADYCTMFEPVASEYQQAGKGYIVASVGEASGEVPYTCYMAKSSWLNKNQDTAKGFLRAITKAIKYLHEHTAQEVAPYLKAAFNSTSEASIATSIESYKRIDSWVRNMAMEEAALTRLQDIIDNAGELPKRVKFADLVNTSLAQAVYGEIYK
ncbi:MAG: ABC transporter substrate-binding protein [Clostridia bacterium]|nr:ABC transporter substrate-binding protein [Clostridia bacterium]